LGMSAAAGEADAPERGVVLSNYEASKILQSIRKGGEGGRQESLRQLLDKSQEYAEMFSHFSSDMQHEAAKESIRMALQPRDDDDVLSESEFARVRQQREYDTVTLLNLCPRTVEEARAYVPALLERTDEEVHSLLRDLGRGLQ